MNVSALWFTILALVLPFPMLAQTPRKRNDEKRCVTCHIQWHTDQKQDNNLIPAIRAQTIIDGQAGMVSDQEMCLSCHDGYVMDSREVFTTDNHRTGLDITHITLQGLPLSTEQDIYCGTCHTPHALKPNKRGGVAPFLREAVDNSTLCLDCHADHSAEKGGHPIHTDNVADRKLLPETFLGPNGGVECMTCHPIHQEQAVQGVAGADRTALCSSCHEPYFQITNTDHDLTDAWKNRDGAIGPSLEGQDACAGCHASHGGQVPGMWAVKRDPRQGVNAACLGCHGEQGAGREKPFKHQGHPVDGKVLQHAVPNLGLQAGDDLACTSCHDPHQWDHAGKHAVGPGNEEGTEYTSFLRLPDDAQGQLCTACHADQQNIVSSDHSISREGFQQYLSSTGEMHGQCSVCHDTHGPSGLRVSTTGLQQDVSRALCESCHTGIHSPATIGHADHPLGVTMPAGVTLPSFKDSLTCITCHDPHSWGRLRQTSPTADLEGNDANSFLRKSNWPRPELCLTCHAEQELVLETAHDLQDGDHSACSFCHTVHNAGQQTGLLAAWEDQAGATFGEKTCFSCHREAGPAKTSIPRSWKHPSEYGTLPPNIRGNGDFRDFPLFDAQGPNQKFGYVDCLTCHDPHVWSFREALQVPESKTASGDHLSSFLRNAAGETLCTDCHGPAALWKYNYYHDPVRRLRY